MTLRDRIIAALDGTGLCADSAEDRERIAEKVLGALAADDVKQRESLAAFARGIGFAAHLVRYVGSDIKTKAQIVAYLEDTERLWDRKAVELHIPPGTTDVVLEQLEVEP